MELEIGLCAADIMLVLIKEINGHLRLFYKVCLFNLKMAVYLKYYRKKL